MRLYAIGDVHGRLDLLRAMHTHIAAEIEVDRPADWRIIHLGDYVDRGPESAGVLDHLVRVIRDDSRNICLAGNHDLGFLEFLANPAEASLFAQHGGVETAMSYGVRLGFESVEVLRNAHAELLSAMPEAHRSFLRALPYSASFGDFFFCHAGIRPGVPLDEQAEEDLVWIRGEFHRADQLHPKVVVHGHTPVAEADVRRNRVNIDTGAYYSGRLTALVIDGRTKRLLEVSEERR